MPVPAHRPPLNEPLRQDPPSTSGAPPPSQPTWGELRRQLAELGPLRSPRSSLRALGHHLAHAHTSSSRLAAAVAVGLFLGSSPFYGMHLVLCIGAALLLRLNVLVVYLAANISNPLIAPFLLYGEWRIGHALLGISGEGPDIAAIRQGIREDAVGSVWSWMKDAATPLILGWLALGTGMAVLGGSLTFWGVTRRRRSSSSPPDSEGERLLAPADGTVLDAISALIQKSRSLPSRFEQGYVRGKLTRDPVFRALLRLSPPSASVVDIGCGRGLLLSLWGERGARFGVDWDEKRLATARLLCGGREGITLIRGDVRTTPLPEGDFVLLIDVLHYLRPEEQQALVERAIRCVRSGGSLVIRDMHRSQGSSGGLLHRIQETLTTALGLNRGERVSPPDLQRLGEDLGLRGFHIRLHPLPGWWGSTDTLLIASLPGTPKP